MIDVFTREIYARDRHVQRKTIKDTGEGIIWGLGMLRATRRLETGKEQILPHTLERNPSPDNTLSWNF